MQTSKERFVELRIGRKPVSKETHDRHMGALNALRRASIKARRKAIETDGYVLTWRNGEMVYDTEVSPCRCNC